MARAIEERLRARERAIQLARSLAECARERLGLITVVLVGSYARGDFNEWSGVDVLIVAREGSLPANPLRRWDLLEGCLAAHPGVEPIIIDEGKWRRLLAQGNPLALEALSAGLVLLDELGLFRRRAPPGNLKA